MATVLSTTGASFHLWGLPDASAPEPSVTKTFTTLKNEMSQGYYSQRLLGLQSGLRRWELRLPTLGGTGVGPTLLDVFGATVSRLQYVRNLVKYNQGTGVPFAYTHNGQYYLVDVVNTPQYTKKKGVEIYSTSLQLKERRINGQTIFSPTLMSSLTRYNFDWFDQQGHSTNWSGNEGALSLTKNGDVVFGAAQQNGLNIVRLNGSADTGYLTNNTGDWATPVKEIWIVMKMRQTTFSNNAGILTNASGGAMLVGQSGTTKFQNPGVAGLEYYLNGVQYPLTDMQAPMDTFGVVQLRFTGSGMATSVIQFGRNGAIGGTYAKQDLAEIVSSSALIPQNDGRELMTHESVKWGIDL